MADGDSESATPAWRLGAWSARTGFPAAVAYQDGRLVFAGGNTLNLFLRIDGSAQPGYNRFTPGAGDDADAWTRELGAAGTVRHLVGSDTLVALTSSAEYELSGSGDEDAITPSKFRSRRIGGAGASSVPPAETGTSVLFVDRQGERLYEVITDDYFSKLLRNDLTLLAEHVGRRRTAAGSGKFVALAVTERPHPIVYAAREDGEVSVLTYLREEKVQGWARHKHAAADIESVAVIPGGDEDEVWAVCNRGSDRTIERLTPHLRAWQAREYGFYVDSGVSREDRIAAALTPGATSGAGVRFTTNGGVFGAADIGRKIVYIHPAAGGEGVDDWGRPQYRRAVAEIVSRESETEVTCNIESDFPSTDAIAPRGWHMTLDEVTGLSRLNGEVVAVYGDGEKQALRTVVNGRVAVDPPAAVVHVGFDYTWRWRTLPIESGSRQGTAQGKPTAFSLILARVVRTWKFSAGLAGQPLYPQRDDAEELLTGDVEIQAGGGFQQHAILVLQGDDGPAEFVLLVPHANVGEAR